MRPSNWRRATTTASCRCVEAIAAHYGVTPNRVVTGTGCSGATSWRLARSSRAGDDVLIERPAYDPLIGACRLMGVNVRRFDRRAEDGYAVDPARSPGRADAEDAR